MSIVRDFWAEHAAMHKASNGMVHPGTAETCISRHCDGPAMERLRKYVEADERQNAMLAERVARWTKASAPEKDRVTIELDQSEAASVVDALISAADSRRDKKGRLHEVIADFLDDLAIRIHEARGVTEGHPR